MVWLPDIHLLNLNEREIRFVVDGYVTGYASGELDTCSGPVQQLGGLQYVKAAIWAANYEDVYRRVLYFGAVSFFVEI